MDNPDNKPVYCMHCTNWYAPTQANQCNIGSKPIVSSSLNNAAGFQAVSQENIYGKPSELNNNHNCGYYREVGLFEKIIRKMVYHIPLKPTVESKVSGLNC